MDTMSLTPPPDLAGAAMHALTTRKTVEYLYATAALGASIGTIESGLAGDASDPSLRWTLLEYRTDASDIDRELSRYISLSAPKAIADARRTLVDAKAVHLSDVGSLEFDLDDAEQRWSAGCRQKLQALRVKLTALRDKTAPEGQVAVEVGGDTGGLSEPADGLRAAGQVVDANTLAPHYFIYLATDEVASVHASTKRLRARNYLGSWLQADDVELDVSAVAVSGWPLPAFQRWIQGLVAMRRKPTRDDALIVPSDCVLAATAGRCYAMDLQTFIKLDLKT